MYLGDYDPIAPLEQAYDVAYEEYEEARDEYAAAQDVLNRAEARFYAARNDLTKAENALP